MNLAAHIANRYIINSFSHSRNYSDYFQRQQKVQEALFTIEPYRMQRVGLHHKITLYNDSRATNPNATWFSLSQCPNNTVWIAGGVNKYPEYLLHEPHMIAQYKKIKTLIVLGDSTLWDCLGRYISVIIHCDKDNLLSVIKKIAVEGDTVLFSPSAASFDLFENYEARGAWFSEQVILHL